MANKACPAETEKMRAELKSVFDAVDANKSGSIDKEEFEKVLTQYNASPSTTKKIEPAKIKELAGLFIQACDSNADGKVNFEEFFQFLVKNCPHK
jgi:Ca2+-binding EF-hand superfamily protein